MEKYSFIKPEDYQPSGFADFSKIYNCNNATVTFTNVETNKTVTHNIETTEITDEKGNKKLVYILPEPFAKTA